MPCPDDAATWARVTIPLPRDGRNLAGTPAWLCVGSGKPEAESDQERPTAVQCSAL